MGLAKKLQIKLGMQVGILNPPEGFMALLDEWPAGTTLVAEPEEGSLDLLVLFVKSMAELESQAPRAIGLVKYDGILWIAYPKKSSKIKTDIDRDSGWAMMSKLGMAGVAMVAIDETWSAMRYRPAERVGK